jgi:UDP:flavonoid glycosyltransferase YjiC (YdhE family)
MSDGKTIVFFPEAAFGPALNSVGIAQVCREMGHKPVFIADKGFARRVSVQHRREGKALERDRMHALPM